MRILKTRAETTAFGQKMAAGLGPNSVLALVGELGAGKTCLVQGILAGLGATESVGSPTFTLVHEYRTGRLPVYHFDFYRIKQSAELLELGWEDYLERGGVVVVEWADKFPELFPQGSTGWELRHEGSDRRSIRPWSPP